MKKIKLDKSKLLLAKSKITSLSNPEMAKMTGGTYEMTLPNFTCETDTTPNTSVECDTYTDTCPGSGGGGGSITGIIYSVFNCYCHC
jgi:hypothetical protein